MRRTLKVATLNRLYRTRELLLPLREPVLRHTRVEKKGLPPHGDGDGEALRRNANGEWPGAGANGPFSSFLWLLVIV